MAKRVKEKNKSFSDSGCGRAEGVVMLQVAR
jgi:hypothetical protein